MDRDHQEAEEKREPEVRHVGARLRVSMERRRMIEWMNDQVGE